MLFQNDRYMTRGVNAEIPLTVQLFIWNCIDHLPEERDHFQVFVLEPMGVMQRISHTSEQPEYHMEYLILSDNPITAKLYVIDDGDHTTMLLAEEY